MTEAGDSISTNASLEDRVMEDAVPVISDSFYFVRCNPSPTPVNSDSRVFFCTDSELVYDSFFDDFGPLNIAKVYRYCEMVNRKLQSDGQNVKLVHYSSSRDDRRFLNAAWLVGAYSILKLKRSPVEIFPLLEKAAQRSMIGFRDASFGPSTYNLSLEDCLTGLYMAIQNKFFDYDSFDLREYEHYERVENGDFNWITPKFLAFCGPHNKTRTDGYPVHAPEEYFQYFKSHNVTTIIRLNSPQYPSERFLAAGFEHFDLIFPDGTSPGEAILQEFLNIVENAKGAVAVHCKAGLGRTGTLIAAYLMKHYRFTAAQAIAWTRIARPGSVIGQQQHFLESMKDKLWADGAGETSTYSQEEVKTTTVSRVTSKETVDEHGRTTVVEYEVVETVTHVPVHNGHHVEHRAGSSEMMVEEDMTTQGDMLNMKKAQRAHGSGSSGSSSDRQTRSMSKAANGDGAHITPGSRTKKKKQKTR